MVPYGVPKSSYGQGWLLADTSLVNFTHRTASLLSFTLSMDVDQKYVSSTYSGGCLVTNLGISLRSVR